MIKCIKIRIYVNDVFRLNGSAERRRKEILWTIIFYFLNKTLKKIRNKLWENTPEQRETKSFGVEKMQMLRAWLSYCDEGGTVILHLMYHVFKYKGLVISWIFLEWINISVGPFIFLLMQFCHYHFSTNSLITLFICFSVFGNWFWHILMHMTCMCYVIVALSDVLHYITIQID